MRPSSLAQWHALPLTARLALVGLATGLLFGLAIALWSGERFLAAGPDAHPPRAEILELGVYVVTVLALPVSLALRPILALPFPGSWFAFMVLAPALNLTAAGLVLGGILRLIRRAGSPRDAGNLPGP